MGFVKSSRYAATLANIVVRGREWAEPQPELLGAKTTRSSAKTFLDERKPRPDSWQIVGSGVSRLSLCWWDSPLTRAITTH